MISVCMGSTGIDLTLEWLASVLTTSVSDLLAEEPSQVDEQALSVMSWLSALQPQD